MVTSLVPYGESDCIARLFSRDEGRLSAYYRRGLSSNKNKTGVIQAPCFANIGYISPTENKLAQLVSCDIDPKSFTYISSLKVFGFYYYITELIERFLPELEPAPKLFAHSLDAFSALSEHGPNASILRSFELKLLDFCGYLPELALNSKDYQIAAYDPSSCQFLDHLEQDTLEFSNQALKLAISMQAVRVGQILSPDTRLIRLLGNIFLARLKLMGGEPLKSVLFLNQLKS